MLPRGLRNKNPGNIRHGQPWQGLADTQTDSDFAQFQSATWGLRALAKLLQTYQHKHGLETVAGIISRYAPANENATRSYIEHVADRMGVATDERIDLDCPETLGRLMQAIVIHENGPGPRDDGDWFPPTTYRNALQLAGLL